MKFLIIFIKIGVYNFTAYDITYYIQDNNIKFSINIVPNFTKITSHNIEDEKLKSTIINIYKLIFYYSSDCIIFINFKTDITKDFIEKFINDIINIYTKRLIAHEYFTELLNNLIFSYKKNKPDFEEESKKYKYDSDINISRTWVVNDNIQIIINKIALILEKSINHEKSTDHENINDNKKSTDHKKSTVQSKLRTVLSKLRNLVKFNKYMKYKIKYLKLKKN